MRLPFGRRMGPLEMIGVIIHGFSNFSEQQIHLLALIGILGVLPVDIDTVEAKILDESNARGSELLAAFFGACWLVKVLVCVGVRPAADGEQDLEVAVRLLEEEKLLQVAIDIVARVLPGVTLPVLLDIGPLVGKDDFAVLTVIRKGIQDVGQFVGGDLVGCVTSAVDALSENVSGFNFATYATNGVLWV